MQHTHGRDIYTPFSAVDDPELPDRFQNYALDKNKIGEGPISFCYRAKRVDNGKEVRLKVLRRRICQLPVTGEFVSRLGPVLAQFHGENLVPFEGTGVHNSILFFEFGYRDAVSLRQLIESDAPFHPDLVVLIISGIIAGLNQIHGIRPSPGMGNLIPLHKNLKPENVLITPDGLILLADIEFVQIADLCDKNRLELPYSVSVYQSPEQLLRDGYADRRSDIFSLGLVMCEMATGSLPFEGGNFYEARQNIREDKRDKIAKMFVATKDPLRKELVKQLATIIESLLEHSSENRPQSLIELENQCLHYLETSHYDNPARVIADFLRLRSFQVERKRKSGFLDRLLGG